MLIGHRLAQLDCAEIYTGCSMQICGSLRLRSTSSQRVGFLLALKTRCTPIGLLEASPLPSELKQAHLLSCRNAEDASQSAIFANDLSMSVGFLAHPPLRLQRLNQTRAIERRVLTCSDERLPPVSLDPMRGFEAFCWQTQDLLCAHMAEMDGLGTFEDPFWAGRVRDGELRGKRRHRQATRAMKGGRAFRTALVTVWSKPADFEGGEDGRGPKSARKRTRLLTCLDKQTGSVQHRREAAGVSIKLQPRNLAAPALRWSAHYFQVGGGETAWWFSGAADLCLGAGAVPSSFVEERDVFLGGWQRLCDRHRVEEAKYEQRCFLDSCYGTSDLFDAPCSPESLDRLSSFAFINAVVEHLLPTYLPLVASTLSHVSSDPLEMSPSLADAPLSRAGLQDVLGNEQTSRFILTGGAACKSSTVRGSPIGSWRIDIAPSSFSAAGRTYDSMRNGDASSTSPFAYL